ncbi:MAG: hypothetical protein AAF752_08480 [Bacteroidota bacterium]
MTSVPLLAQPVEIYEFTDARSVSADRLGIVYVVDGTLSTVTRLTPAGAVIDGLGGAGSGDYAFDEPVDIDPSNGLVMAVADAGNGVVKRYTNELLHIETLPVAVPDIGDRELAGFRGIRVDEGSLDTWVRGRPVAVASTLEGEVFALDADRGLVLKWDSTRRLERVFGGSDANEGMLVEPVAMETDNEGTVYVADAGTGRVHVFDRFGTFARVMALDAGEIVNLGLYRDRLLVVQPDGVQVFTLQGRLLDTVSAPVDARLVDADVVLGPAGRSTLLLLTERALFAYQPE